MKTGKPALWGKWQPSEQAAKAISRLQLSDSIATKAFADGMAALFQEKYARAIKHFNAAIELGTGLNTKTYFYRGISFYKTRQFSKAEEDFKTVLDLDPHTADAYGFLYLIYTHRTVRKALAAGWAKSNYEQLCGKGSLDVFPQEVTPPPSRPAPA